MKGCLRFVILFCLFAGLWSPRSYGQSCEDLFLHSTPDQFLANRKLTVLETQNSSYMLLDAWKAIVANYYVSRAPLDNAFTISDKKIVINENLPRTWLTANGQRISVDQLLTIYAVIYKLYVHFGVDKKYASQFGFAILKDVVEALGENFTAFQNFIRPDLLNAGMDVSGRFITKKLLLEGRDQVGQLIEVSKDYDNPYLAGYAFKNPKRTYQDRDFKNIMIVDGKKIDLTMVIAMHEVTETLVMYDLPDYDERYLHPHQIAQRLEKAIIEAMGISWYYYQHEYMTGEIARAEDPSRILTRVADDTDLTPYEKLKDHKTIERMKNAFVHRPAPSKMNMQIHTIRPGVLHVVFEDRIEMAKTLLRFQEYFESPRFRSQFFSLPDYIRWYTKKNGKFDYYEFWGDGFNIPNSVFENFFNGKMGELSQREQEFLELFKDRRHAKLYVIVTAKNSQDGVLDHEIAHALYYLNPEYKKEIFNILKDYDIEKVKKFLENEYGDYHKAVLLDEAHAWLMHNSLDLQKDGFDIGPYHEAIERLQTVYKKYR